MQVTIGKIAALFLAIAYLIAAWVTGDGLPFAATVALGLLLPLALIWFPEALGSWTRWGNQARNVSSPSWLVVTLGWAFLVGFPLFLLLRGHG